MSFIQLEGPLFERVMKDKLFEDAKTFVDAIPKTDPPAILKAFLNEHDSPSFCLKTFIDTHFIVPGHVALKTKEKPEQLSDYIKSVWPALIKPMKAQSEYDTLLTLPKNHIVPGGRFRECFYWDTYFSALGLHVDGKFEQVADLVENFNYLIHLLGFIPNGNRVYFLSRSQPPFFSLMIDLVSKQLPRNKLKECLISLEKEYSFWMKGSSQAKLEKSANKHVVYVSNPHYKGLLNRYFDPIDKPRPEAFYKESALGEKFYEKGFFSQLRSVCESGWDFSSRFLKDPTSIGSAEALSLCPVDLHCLLYLSEKKLFDFYKESNKQKAEFYEQAISNRKEALHTLFWKKDFFYDYHFEKGRVNNKKTLAGLFPLYVKLATETQAKQVADVIKTSFLQPGGFVTTLEPTSHQWDWPNGWAPLQWVTVVSLVNYGYKELALEGATRWLNMVKKVYKEKHTVLEKYNVVTASSDANHGEYEMQEGFGWTNGVSSALEHFVQTGLLLS